VAEAWWPRDLLSMSPWRGTPIIEPTAFSAKVDAVRRHARRCNSHCRGCLVGDGERVLLAIEAAEGREIRARPGEDPWAPAGLLGIGSMEPWAFWPGGGHKQPGALMAPASRSHPAVRAFAGRIKAGTQRARYPGGRSVHNETGGCAFATIWDLRLMGCRSAGRASRSARSVMHCHHTTQCE
jgi:hypothetical protein